MSTSYKYAKPLKKAPPPRKTSTKQVAIAEPTAPRPYELPPLSVTLKEPATADICKILKRKTIRRNAPPGENLKQIKEILRGLQNEDVSVAEFVGMIGPSTGDNGDVLRQVLAEDLTFFKKMARSIYETMTQDVSDVLANQQVQLVEFNQEKLGIYTEKMMRCIDDIYRMCPDFNFEQYFQFRDKYLELKFPMPREIQASSSEAELQRRQQAYHRLQWLRSEGDRLGEENTRLQHRLTELKKAQKMEILKAQQKEDEAERQREELEAQEEQKQNELEDLNTTLEKTMIDNEESLRKADDTNALTSPIDRKQFEKDAKKKKKVTKIRRPEWASTQAADIDENIIEGARQSESQKTISRKGSRKQKRDPFHFSPIKTPPPKQKRSPSPFHFSPPAFHQSPPAYSPPQPPVRQPSPRRERSAAAAARQSPQGQVVVTRTVADEEYSRPRPPPGGRRTQGPRDTWGGFG